LFSVLGEILYAVAKSTYILNSNMDISCTDV
jgi:hypothetical protein